MQEHFHEQDFTHWATEVCCVFCCLLTLQVFSSVQHSGFKMAQRVQLPRFTSFLLINIVPCKTVERVLSVLSSGNTAKNPWVIKDRQCYLLWLCSKTKTVTTAFGTEPGATHAYQARTERSSEESGISRLVFEHQLVFTWEWGTDLFQ